MTAHVYATRSGADLVKRSQGWPAPYNLVDPAAIPPPGLSQLSRAGVLVTPSTMLQVDVVFTALRIISNNVIKMGDLWAYEEDVSDEGIPYRRFLPERPAILANTFGGGGLGGRAGSTMQCTGMDRTVWSLGLFGEAFWYVLARDKTSGNAGYPVALEVLHPLFMDVKPDGRGASRFLYGASGHKTELDPDDVVHIPFKSLPGARRGLSPMEYVGVAAALAMAAYEFGASWFSQGVSPSFILTTDQKLGQPEVQRIAQKFLIDHAGLSQAHLPLVLDSGLKASKVLNTPDEAQYLQTLEFSRQVIGSWFGIPASKIPSSLNPLPPMPPHARQEEAISFLQDTLSGYLVPLEEAFSGLLPQGVRAAFAEHQLARPDAQFLSQLVLALRTSQAASINDVRTRYLGWGPVEGGDAIMAPLASNVAPEQTDGSQSPASKPPEDQ